MWKNLDECNSFLELKNAKKVDISSILKREDAGKRIISYSNSIISGMHYNYAAKQVDDAIIDILQKLSDEQELISKYKALLKGEMINTGEGRLVLHHLTRAQKACTVFHNGVNIYEFYKKELEKIRSFVEAVHSEKIRSSSDEAFVDVVQIGIGGSDLGPRCLYIALEEGERIAGRAKLKGHFISNVDPEDAMNVLLNIQPEKTLFILVSKSGTTEETLANEKLVCEYLACNGIKNVKKNIVVVTSSSSPLAKDEGYLASFFIDDFVGGRYSSTSACGAVLLSLCFGNEVFGQLLQGAAEADESALNEDIRQNATLMDALIGVYERNVLGYNTTAVLPYAQSLARFPAHLQQLDMESSGKAVNRDFQKISYPTGAILFGEAGTNGQHSFYQFLHQSDEVVPLQFIAFKESAVYKNMSKSTLLISKKPALTTDASKELETEYVQTIRENHNKLLTNLIAQIYAFAVGKEDSNKNKHFEGCRPSSLIYADSLNARTLGALLAHFENKVIFQVFICNINSFDQEGVQLGKKIEKQIESGKLDGALEAYSKMMLNK